MKEPVNIYFYDGSHTKLSQEMAFTYYNDILDQVFVAIVDDWNRPVVQAGTKKAFEKLNYRILFEIAMPGLKNNDAKNWWNGLYIAVIKKG